jgi:hypothetical protein
MEADAKEGLAGRAGSATCKAHSRTGKPCTQQNPKWLVGDFDDDDPVPVCDHHAALARRLGWPLRKKKSPNAPRSATPEDAR